MINDQRKNELQIAVVQRIARNQLDILVMGTGISKEKISEFAETGKIDERYLMVLELMA